MVIGGLPSTIELSESEICKVKETGFAKFKNLAKFCWRLWHREIAGKIWPITS